MGVGEVRPGYKRTEVGVIPEDWEVRCLRDLLLERPTYGLNAAAAPFDSALPTFLRITDITEDGRFDHSAKQSVSSPMSSTFLAADGDIFFARTGASVGKSYHYEASDGPLVFAGFLIRAKPNAELLSSRYLSYFLQTHTYWNWIRTESARSGQPGVNAEQYGDMPVPLPTSLMEQDLIAKRIHSLVELNIGVEKTITKKRDLKQAAMQELLRPRPEWITNRIGAIAPLQRGFDLPANRIVAGSFPIVYSNGALEHHNRSMVKGPGVVTGRSGTLGAVHFVQQDFWPHNTTLWVTNFLGHHPKFIYYLFCSLNFHRYGGGSGVPTLNRNDLHDIVISVPSTTQEQQDIAAILSDMDAEIAVLEARLAKFRDLKRGMMQNLLTGAIRLR